MSQSSPPALGSHITQGRKKDFRALTKNATVTVRDVLGHEQPLQPQNEPPVYQAETSPPHTNRRRKRKKNIKDIT